MSPQRTEKDTFQTLDAFVRDQSWDSLGLTAETCTGSACQTERPLPIHGAIPERLAVMLVSLKLTEVFPRQVPACEAGALETSLTAERPPAAAGAEPEPLRMAAVCEMSKGVRASFLRMDLDQKILDAVERDAPDGLSLRGPITFVVMNKGKESIYTQMYDGKLDAANVRRVLEALGGKDPMAFATGDKQGKNPQPVIRFIN